MERTSTFANIGTDFIAGKTELVNGLPKEMCFSVSKTPLGYQDDWGQFTRLKGFSTVINDATGKAYGAVSDNYEPIDNPTALGSIQYIPDMEIVKYGQTYTNMQYVIGKLDDVNILGDAFTPYLVFRNSFDGRYPIQVAISPLRIVCQNQLNWAFKNANNTINIKHTKSAKEKIEEAHKIILRTNDYLKELNKQAEKYAGIKMSDKEAVAIMRTLFPITDEMTDRQKQTVQDKIANFERAMRESDNANFKGTAWGLINAYTDVITHPVVARQTAKTADNQFMAVSFDPRALAKLITLIDNRVIVA